MGVDRWQTVGALVDPVRRALYEFVRRQDHPVTREEAADGQGISRNLAAFHLDKLVDAGLLGSRVEARSGPRGRGRAPRIYVAVDDAVVVAVPDRRYELVGQILVDAVAEEPADASGAARRRAHERGVRDGRALAGRDPEAEREPEVRLDPEAERAPDPVRDPTGELAVARRVLAELGFEPDPAKADRIVLRNCPFHALATRQPALVCGLNHAYISGLLEGMGTTRLDPRLAPSPGHCCVEVAGVAGITS